MVKFEPEKTTSSVEQSDNALLGRDRSSLLKAAQLVIKEFGDEAGPYAASRADVLCREGEILVSAAWRRVVPMIEELQRIRPISVSRLILATGRRGGKKSAG
jgi:hypothetical protein